MFGKKKCKILKEIRQKIADENDIPYVTRECTHKGDCSGTCPYCEEELRDLERKLEKRRLGKTVTVTAVAAGIALNISGCVDPKPFEHAVGIVPNSESACTEKTDPASGDVLLPVDETDELEGNIAAEEPSDDGEIFVIGEVPVEDSRDFAP